jgi:hypothetical protein
VFNRSPSSPRARAIEFALGPCVAASLSLAGLTGAARADPVALGPTPYLSFADSPFASGSFGYLHLETFEDHLLNAPGVSASAGGVTSVVFGPTIHDSVDADDGVIDGSGLNGDSFYSASGAAGITFTFSAAALGSLPTSAGLVWTDAGAGSSVTFSAFGPGGTLLFTQTAIGIADGSNNGETAEDRFFGVVNGAGISAIFISNTGGGIEIDHLQYAAAVPEPQTYALMLAGLAAGSLVARRRRGM